MPQHQLRWSADGHGADFDVGIELVDDLGAGGDPAGAQAGGEDFGGGIEAEHAAACVEVQEGGW